jgi:hypothetical protein
MMFWGDVILHQPELIAELPKDVIALQWGYEADHPFDKEGAQFKNAGVPFYVCPGTSSWNSIAGRTENAIANLKAAAEAGLRHGAIGYLITDWGDNGHLQYLPVSFPGFAAGSAFSWCMESNRDLKLEAVLNLHAFKDPTKTLAKVGLDLGNVYRVCGKANNNGSALFRLLVPSPNDPNPEKGMTEEGFRSAEVAIESAIQMLGEYPTDEMRLIRDEFQNAARMLRLCIAIGRNRVAVARQGHSSKVETVPPRGDRYAEKRDTQEIISEHRRLWLARNRPGGLEDSVKRISARSKKLHE